MPILPINIGTVANDGTGDPLRDGGADINANFDLLGAKAVVFSGVLDLSGGQRIQPESTLVGHLDITLPPTMEVGAECIMRLKGGSISLPSRCYLARGLYDPSRQNILSFKNVQGTTSGTAVVVCEIRTVPNTTVTGLYYRQNANSQANLFRSWADAINTPSGTPASANKYSKLYLLEQEGRHWDGNFYFLLKYGDSTDIRWRQRSNPLNTYMQVQGYRSISGTGQIPQFGGLCRANNAFTEFTVRPGAPATTELSHGALATNRFALTPFEYQPGVLFNNQLAELSIFTP